MDASTVTAILCGDNPFIDYFSPLMYSKDKIKLTNIGYNSDMICPGKPTFDVQSYDPRTARWCLLMFLVESFKITEKHVRSQCYIDEDEFPNLDMVPYMRFCQMLGWNEVHALLDDYFWDNENNDPEYIKENYIPGLKRAFKFLMNVMFKRTDESFKYSLDIVLLKDHRYLNGVITLDISSDIQ